MNKKRKKYAELIEKMIQGAYKCQNCSAYGYVKMFPATINGIVEDVTEISIDGINCVHCQSENVVMVFSTKDDAEAQAYYKTIRALAGN